ncbi:hypothetical protein J6590_044610 [Homalodisca vitripennis]|nr:hypothetical protein J6590_044610 [Homalodisca vitripennis]
MYREDDVSDAEILSVICLCTDTLCRARSGRGPQLRAKTLTDLRFAVDRRSSFKGGSHKECVPTASNCLKSERAHLISEE